LVYFCPEGKSKLTPLLIHNKFFIIERYNVSLQVSSQFSGGFFCGHGSPKNPPLNCHEYLPTHIFNRRSFVEKSRRRFGWLLAAITGLLLVSVIAGCQGLSPTSGAATTQTPATAATPTAVPYVLKDGKTTASGLQYTMLTPGSGEAPQVGNIISMQYIATLPDGTELANTYTDKQPATTIWGRNQLLAGWEEGIGLMKAGGKIRLAIPPALAFGAEGTGSIPPNTTILMDVELLSVKPAPLPTEIAADKLTKATSGLQYYDLSAGSGAEAAKNSTVTTSFTLWVKTASGYDYVVSSEGSEPISFVVGRLDRVFPGWDEGVIGMKVDGKRMLVIPPDLGLGAQGSGDIIPPNATLVMEIQLVSTRDPQVATKVDEKDYTTTASGLKYYDLKVGTGDSPTTGKTVVVNYTGWLQDGTQFDSSLDSGQPFSFTLGQGNVIPGWDEGVATMKPGGKRQLVIPAALGYGDTGAGTMIPPGATLIFEVELISIK
jgi:peptidylprolyl isomerase